MKGEREVTGEGEEEEEVKGRSQEVFFLFCFQFFVMGGVCRVNG